MTYNIKKGTSFLFFDFNQSFTKPLVINVNLVEKGAQVIIFSKVVGRKKERYPWSLTVHHKKGETKARILIKAILDKTAATDFTGLIKIDREAKGVESFLEHRTILLSKQAKARVSPMLEIKAHQVQASHAATVAYLDPEQLFYLKGRGLDEKKARKLIIDGFLSEVKPK